jgi:hypothetical protein
MARTFHGVETPPMEIELAHREANGIEVSLLWSKQSNQVRVQVFDATFESGFEFEVDGSDALDAFNHPFAYVDLVAA